MVQSLFGGVSSRYTSGSQIGPPYRTRMVAHAGNAGTVQNCGRASVGWSRQPSGRNTPFVQNAASAWTTSARAQPSHSWRKETWLLRWLALGVIVLALGVFSLALGVSASLSGRPPIGMTHELHRTAAATICRNPHESVHRRGGDASFPQRRKGFWYKLEGQDHQ